MMNSSGDAYGKLVVSVFTGRGALPVEGAIVRITQHPEQGGTDTLAVRVTNENGLIEAIALPAPPMSESMKPRGEGDTKKPYSVYNIIVASDGFYPFESASAPIFASITAYMQVDLIPLAEYEGPTAPYPPDTQTTESSDYPNL